MASKYDYLIAGGGIAGLYTAYCINKQYPKARICILEASGRLGGRLHSIPLEGTVIEAGGARFNSQQYRILGLIHELGLDSKKIEISSGSRYIPVHPNYDSQLEHTFPEIDDIIQKLSSHIHQHNIPDNTLVNNNLLDIIHTIYSKQYPTIKKYLISRYPYYSELHSLNALEGLSLFTHEFSKKMKYFILAGGLEQLITTISSHLKKYSNIDIHLNQPLDAITSSTSSTSSTLQNNRHEKLYTVISKDENGNKEYVANKIILALPQSALIKIRFLTSYVHVRRLINSIRPEPLYRIYARYPLNETTGKVWFADMQKVITNLPIKYIIPSNVEKGIVMISYTDSRFARYWMNKLSAGDNILEKELARQLKILFPDLDIPPPIWIKHYYWDKGAGYWKKGCDRKDIIPRITQPLAEQDIYICNENYSSHQAWVEGSLESANYVLDKLAITRQPSSNPKKSRSQITRKQTPTTDTTTSRKTKVGGARKKWPTYTLAEVAKHARKSDAWIVINGKVADITKWIPKHPGGNIIMKGVGKDATNLFNSIGHDEYAKKILKQYQIGILKN